jgi:Uma2 family endonuclease
MSMMPVTAPMTATEYLANADETRKTELIDGVVVVTEPMRLHQRVVFDIAVELRAWTTQGAARGEVSMPLDVRIDDHNVFAPDVLWYAEGRAPATHAGRPYEIPDLVVEVRSPSTWRYDIGAKKSAYERNGLRELWLVDTAGSVVLAFRRSLAAAPTFDVAIEFERGSQLTSPLLAGFALPLTSLFRD